ncbi:MAG: nucleotidyltransferase family protein [Bacteroidota bacterium]|jgi:NDP-sugar pyrophosphorylase family protein
MKAFILAAGLGTRLRPITDSKPKALVEINGITFLEIVVQKLIRSGFKSVIINVHHFAEQIVEFVESKNFFGIEIKFSDERNLLLETGGGIKKAAWFFDDHKPFLVHNVDILSGINLTALLNHHINNKSIATLAVQKRKSSRYFLFDEDSTLCGWTNEKENITKLTRKPVGELSRLAFSGIQILEPAVFDCMIERDVFPLMELYLSIASKHRITYFDHSNSMFIDLGKKENLTEAEKLIGN